MLVNLESGIIAVYLVAPLAGMMTTATDCQYHVLGFTFSPWGIACLAQLVKPSTSILDLHLS